MKQLYLIGAGGHCRSCIDVIESTGQFRIAGIVGMAAEKDEAILGYSISHVDEDLPSLIHPDNHFLITVGQIKTCEPRTRLFETVQKLGGQLATIVSSRAHVSKHATIGSGTIVMHDALVNASAKIGANCIINTKALVEHDATIGDHCHISTGAIVNGSVIVEDRCFIGSGTVTKESIRIPASSVIGAASWVDGKQSKRPGN